MPELYWTINLFFSTAKLFDDNKIAGYVLAIHAHNNNKFIYIIRISTNVIFIANSARPHLHLGFFKINLCTTVEVE